MLTSGYVRASSPRRIGTTEPPGPVEAGFGVTFISRSAIEAALAAGTLTEARIQGFEPSREIFLARAAGRTLTRVAQAFLDLAHERLP